MIVGDDEMNREIWSGIFSSHFEIEVAQDGKQGLERALKRRDKLCAVLLDIMMPIMDGIEVCEN